MKTPNCPASACRHCRFYQPVGRRGGHCQQLDVPVRGGWTACSLALPPFAPSWEALEELRLWHQEMVSCQEPLSLEGSLACSQADACTQENNVTPSRLTSAVLV